VEFIICDDEKIFRDRIKNIIDRLFINNDEYYHITEFNKFNESFKKIISNGTSKIYILDIEIKDSISGIDIARQIRKSDWESIIIMVTSHNELGYEALKAQIMLLDFISKYDNYESNLEKTISKAILQVNNKKTLTLSSDGISYIIHLDDILYIVKESGDKKCIIKTTYNTITVNKNLNSIIENLDSRFYLTHRSCIVNTEKIKSVDWKNNIIGFENDRLVDLLARDKKKGLKEYVRG
jgi:two-component system response regulator AgrA